MVLHHTILWLKFKNIEVVIKDLIPVTYFQVAAINENKADEHVFNQFFVEGEQDNIYAVDLSLASHNEKTADGLYVQHDRAIYSKAKLTTVAVASVDPWFLPNPCSNTLPLHDCIGYIRKLYEKVHRNEGIETDLGMTIPSRIIRSYYKFYASVANRLHFAVKSI